MVVVIITTDEYHSIVEYNDCGVLFLSPFVHGEDSSIGDAAAGITLSFRLIIENDGDRLVLKASLLSVSQITVMMEGGFNGGRSGLTILKWVESIPLFRCPNCTS